MLNIANIRKARHLTQSQLAEMVGTSQAHLSRLENGDDSASLRLIIDIAQALRVAPADLLGSRSEAEEILVSAYRQASEEAKGMLLGMARSVAAPQLTDARGKP